MNLLLKVIKKPKLAYQVAMLRIMGWLPDKPYLKLKFRFAMGKKLNLSNPQTFSEKLQWMKLYDHRPEYTIMADKVKAKDWVADRIGKDYIIPTLGVWDNPEKIDFDALPNQFVLKCNHNSGTGMFICKDKSKVTPEEWEERKAWLRKGLKENYYKHHREWCYKNIPRRILCEQFMEDKSQNGNLNDYKFFCFNGEVKMLFVATDRFDENGTEQNVKFDFFDRNFKHLDFRNGHPNATKSIEKPACWEEMIAVAERLSEGIPHVRVDLYEINGKVYFGEMTFYHWSGLVPYEPEEWDYKLGHWFHLPDINVTH